MTKNSNIKKNNKNKKWYLSVRMCQTCSKNLKCIISLNFLYTKKSVYMNTHTHVHMMYGFPGGSGDKASACNVGDRG